MGIAKAYTTRVGAGPLPSEIGGDAGAGDPREGARIRRLHRPAAPLRMVRRGGRALLRARERLRHAGPHQARRPRRAGRGQDLHRLPRATGETLTEFPADLSLLEGSEPVYETLPGWQTSTAGVRDFAMLPAGGPALRDAAVGAGRVRDRDRVHRPRAPRDDPAPQERRRVLVRLRSPLRQPRGFTSRDSEPQPTPSPQLVHTTGLFASIGEPSLALARAESAGSPLRLGPLR